MSLLYLPNFNTILKENKAVFLGENMVIVSQFSRCSSRSWTDCTAHFLLYFFVGNQQFTEVEGWGKQLLCERKPRPAPRGSR